MRLRVSVPRLPANATIRLRTWHAVPGQRLAAGATLLDLTVDLGAGIDQDCPPVSICRIVLREDARLSEQLARAEKEVAAGAVLALLETLPDEPDGAGEREARVTVAAVIDHADWWGG